MFIIYIDIILLIILLCLTIFACGYCFYRVHRLQRSGQVAILLRPTKVLFSHKTEDGANEELRTVVAYQNPFTGDYCVNKSQAGAHGYENSMPASPDSGVSESDEYEPLSLEPPEPPRLPKNELRDGLMKELSQLEELTKPPAQPAQDVNRLSKTWNWNYKEYQI